MTGQGNSAYTVILEWEKTTYTMFDYFVWFLWSIPYILQFIIPITLFTWIVLFFVRKDLHKKALYILFSEIWIYFVSIIIILLLKKI